MNADRKLQEHVGISKEEVSLNKGLLASMLIQDVNSGRGNNFNIGQSRVEAGF